MQDLWFFRIIFAESFNDVSKTKMKKGILLWISALLLILAGCGSSDNDENDNNPLFSNMLQISNNGNTYTGNYAVINNKFYIDKMPSDMGPGFIFHCDIKESPDLRTLFIRMRGIKSDIDAFQVGETFLLKLFNASLMPIETSDQYYATEGSIKLVDKKKAGDKDVLTFQINNLAFEMGYTINGIVDFEYERTVY